MPQKTDAQNGLRYAISTTGNDNLNASYMAYRKLLLGVINKIMKSKSAAEDVLRQTFIKIQNRSLIYNYADVSLFTQMLQIAVQTALENVQDKKAGIELLKKDIRTYIKSAKEMSS
jgi:DNA-directed RNA polymerase specialized sigma24 family protein